MMKRKRNTHDDTTTNPVVHPVLQCFYPQILSLRQYLLLRLPIASKTRRRKISQLGLSDAIELPRVDFELGQLLDSTQVGLPPKAVATDQDEARDIDIVSFSQQLLKSTAGATFKPGYFQQGEVGYSAHFIRHFTLGYNDSMPYLLFL
jgi:hypothetical protein